MGTLDSVALVDGIECSSKRTRGKRLMIDGFFWKSPQLEAERRPSVYGQRLRVLNYYLHAASFSFTVRFAIVHSAGDIDFPTACLQSPTQSNESIALRQKKAACIRAARVPAGASLCHLPPPTFIVIQQIHLSTPERPTADLFYLRI